MQCAYCHQDKKLTREHIIPKSFLNKMNIPEMTTWMDCTPNKFINNEMVIKDVCADCNNGVLSELDAYAVDLIVSYNKKLKVNTQSILFRYDFNKLSRWLLKVCFNSARANNCKDDANLYSCLASYIMENKTPNTKFSIYTSLMELNVKDEVYHHLTDQAYEIDHFRICPFRIEGLSAYKCTFRTIMINSFVFIIMVFDNDLTHDEIKEIKRQFLHTYPVLKKLTLKNSITLGKDKTFWVNSLMSHVMLNADYFGKTTSLPTNKGRLNLIEIQRECVEALDLNDLESVLQGFKETRPIALSYMQKVEISVSGYDDDCRELYQIPEFQKYVKLLVEKYPYLIFFLDLSLNFIKVLLYTYINDDFITDTSNNSRTININQKKLQYFIMKSFIGLNQLTNTLVLDDSINRDITLKFNNMLKSVVKTEDEQ